MASGLERPSPQYEIEHPLAVVILGGLVTSTLLNLFIVPALYLKFGRSALAAAEERSEASSARATGTELF